MGTGLSFPALARRAESCGKLMFLEEMGVSAALATSPASYCSPLNKLSLAASPSFCSSSCKWRESKVGEILSLWAEDPDKSSQTSGWEQAAIHSLSDTRQAPQAKPPSNAKSSEHHREQGQIWKTGAKQSCIIASTSICNSFPFKLLVF